MYEKSRVANSNKKEILNEALDLLKRAEFLEETNFAVHKWLAIIIDSYYTLEGTKARITHLNETKAHMEVSFSFEYKIL